MDEDVLLLWDEDVQVLENLEEQRIPEERDVLQTVPSVFRTKLC